MATALDIIRSALLLNGAVAADQTLSASDAADGLTTLNDMLASWALDNNIVYTLQGSTVALVAGQQTYSIARPIRIENALVRDSSNIDHHVSIVGYDDFQVIANKQVQSSYPEVLYCDYATPNSTLYLWQVPASAYSLILVLQQPFTEFTALTDVVTLPPGYNRALRYNLAIELAQYASAIPQKVEDIARESLLLLKIGNHRPLTLQTDPSMLGRGGRANIYSGTF